MSTSPKTYSTGTAELRLVVNRPGFALSAADVGDLKFFFNDFEAEAGVSSTFGPMLAAMEGIAPGSGGCRDHVLGYHEAPLRRHFDGVMAKASRVRRALLAMVARGESELVTVLYRLYGPTPPNCPYSEFRELAPIVELTGAVSAALDEMSRREGAHRGEVTETAIRTDAATEVDRHCRVFWTQVGEERRLAAEIARLEESQVKPEYEEVVAFWKSAGNVVALDAKFETLPPGESAKRDKLEERRYARWKSLERKLTKALAACHDKDPLRLALVARSRALREIERRVKNVRSVTEDCEWASAHASTTSRASAAHELTTSDALSWRLHFQGRRDAKGHPDNDSHKAFQIARAVFITKVRKDAEALRTAAGKAYLAAKGDGS